MLRGGMVPALVDQVLKGLCLLRREQRSQRLCTMIRFCFSRRYIIIVKLSVRETKREATVQKSTPIIYLIIFYLNDPELSVLLIVRLIPNPTLLILFVIYIIRYLYYFR